MKTGDPKSHEISLIRSLEENRCGVIYNKEKIQTINMTNNDPTFWNKWSVEYAKAGTSKCKTCRRNIAIRELRLGENYLVSLQTREYFS